MSLVLVGCVRKVSANVWSDMILRRRPRECAASSKDQLWYLYQGPGNDSWPSIMKQFEIPEFPKAWIQFNAYKIVENQRPYMRFSRQKSKGADRMYYH